MTKTTMTLMLRSNGRELALGPGYRLDINKITGLESSDIDVGLSPLADEDGASHDGTHVEQRPIHIEASFRDNKDTAADREQLIRFFNPKHGGTLTVTVGSRTRQINYIIEGWNLKDRKNLDVKVGFVADLICKDPYFVDPADMVHDVPWLSVGEYLPNDGDDDAGWTAEITSTQDAVNPCILNLKDGRKYGIDGTLNAGDVLTLSTEREKQAILINGESAFTLLSRTAKPYRIPVDGVTLRLDADRGMESMTCTIRYRQRYLGI